MVHYQHLIHLTKKSNRRRKRWKKDEAKTIKHNNLFKLSQRFDFSYRTSLFAGAKRNCFVFFVQGIKYVWYRMKIVCTPTRKRVYGFLSHRIHFACMNVLQKKRHIRKSIPSDFMQIWQTYWAGVFTYLHFTWMREWKKRKNQFDFIQCWFISMSAWDSSFLLKVLESPRSKCEREWERKIDPWPCIIFYGFPIKWNGRLNKINQGCATCRSRSLSLPLLLPLKFCMRRAFMVRAMYHSNIWKCLRSGSADGWHFCAARYKCHLPSRHTFQMESGIVNAALSFLAHLNPKCDECALSSRACSHLTTIMTKKAKTDKTTTAEASKRASDHQQHYDSVI